MKSRLFVLIAAATVIRLLLAFALGLGNDEVYYTTYTQTWQWNYFDHPPLVALLIRLTTVNGYLTSAFFLRLGPIACAGTGTWLIYSITKKLSGERGGWVAACLYSCSFYPGIIAGLFILPDAPEMVLWLTSLFLMSEILNGKKSITVFCLLGLSIGLCTMSKLSGIFLWVGFLGFILTSRRDLFRQPGLYVAGFLSLLIISPVLFWNLSEHFVTYNYHAGRVNPRGFRLQPDSFIQHLLGTLFYNNPINIVILFLSAGVWFRRRPSGFGLLFWLSVPLIGVTFLLSLFNDTLPHWSGPAFTTLLIPGAAVLARDKKTVIQNSLLRLSAGFYLIVICGAQYYFFLLPFQVGSRSPERLGKGDISLDMTGWPSFSREFVTLYHTDAERGRMQGGAIILSDYWFPAAHIDYYIGRPNEIPLFVTGPLNNIHQFAWLNAVRPLPTEGSDAYFIYPSNYYGPPDSALRKCYAGATDSVIIPQFRSGVRVRNFVVLRLRGCRPTELRKQITSIPEN